TEDLARYYRSGGKSSREKLIDLQEELKVKGDLRKGDQDRIRQLNDAIKSKDPNGDFSSARNSIRNSLNSLKRRIRNIASNDPFEKDVLTMLERHIDLFKAMLQRTQSPSTGGGKNRGDQMDAIEDLIREMAEK
ncbi:MAG: hypothetical protein AAF558_13975, partial [Verrucomicrobiota bacterium]